MTKQVLVDGMVFCLSSDEVSVCAQDRMGNVRALLPRDVRQMDSNSRQVVMTAVDRLAPLSRNGQVLISSYRRG